MNKEEKITSCPYLTHEDENRLADKSIQRTKEHFYMEVGHSFINKIVYLIGAVIVGLAAWLHSKGFL